MVKQSVGRKIRELRQHFDMSQKQATALLDSGVSHSSWAYWESHGCPTDRLTEIANLTDMPERTFDWLTNENGVMPSSLTISKPIPPGSGYSSKNMPKKKKKKSSRKNFSPQDRANIIAKIEEIRDTRGLSIKDASESLGIWAGAYNKWRAMDLPAPNDAAVPGVFGRSSPSADNVEPDTTTPAKPASTHTNLPQQKLPKKSGMPSSADKLTPMSVLVMRYQCPRCGQNLQFEEE